MCGRLPGFSSAWCLGCLLTAHRSLLAWPLGDTWVNVENPRTISTDQPPVLGLSRLQSLLRLSDPPMISHQSRFPDLVDHLGAPPKFANRRHSTGAPLKLAPSWWTRLVLDMDGCQNAQGKCDNA